MSKATGDLMIPFEVKEVEGPSSAELERRPTQNVPVVAKRSDEGTIDRRLLRASWGLIPSWAKGTKMGSKPLCTN